MGEHAVRLAGLVEIAATADVAMTDWLMLWPHGVRRELIELVVEDGFDRAIVGAEGPSVRKRTLAYCTQCLGHGDAEVIA